MTATENIHPSEDDCKEMEEESQTPTSNKAKVFKLLSDRSDMTQQTMGQGSVPTNVPIRRNLAEVPPMLEFSSEIDRP